MSNCPVCNKPGSGVCDLCKPVVDKVRELQSKNKKWFEVLFDKNADIEHNKYNVLFEEYSSESSMSKDVFTSILMDLLK